jgi:hypothetical protein
MSQNAANSRCVCAQVDSLSRVAVNRLAALLAGFPAFAAKFFRNFAIFRPRAQNPVMSAANTLIRRQERPMFGTSGWKLQSEDCNA